MSAQLSGTATSSGKNATSVEALASELGIRIRSASKLNGMPNKYEYVASHSEFSPSPVGLERTLAIRIKAIAPTSPNSPP
jgi:hypothetical protein